MWNTLSDTVHIPEDSSPCFTNYCTVIARYSISQQEIEPPKKFKINYILSMLLLVNMCIHVCEIYHTYQLVNNVCQSTFSFGHSQLTLSAEQHYPLCRQSSVMSLRLLEAYVQTMFCGLLWPTKAIFFNIYQNDKRDRKQLNIFERKVYRRILGPEYDNEKNWRILTNKEICASVKKTYCNRDNKVK